MSRPANIHIKEAKEALVHRIESMIGRIPPHFNRWSQQQAVNFKTAAEAAGRYIRRKRVTMPALAKFNAMLGGFWK